MMLPVTPTIRDTAWDAVIFESTSLGVVTLRPRTRFPRLREQWRFLRDSPAVKIVFPQDDASHGAMLDYLFSWLEVDAVFTVRPEKKDFIYPLTAKKADFVSTVAGYIDDASLEHCRNFAKPLEQRQWVVGQRVTMYPAWGGRFSRRKGLAAIKVMEECRKRGIPENISTDPNDVFLGDDWFRFLGDCRFVVGAEGGHGLWDPYGEIQDEVNDYVARHPHASFDEIEDACFYGCDGLHTFPGFAPRILEAAVLGCGQILVEGDYRGFIRPGEHYIPLKADFSNMDAVFAGIANDDLVSSMIAATRRDLVDSPSFRYSSLVERVMSYIENRRLGGEKPLLSSDLGLEQVQRRHEADLVAALVAQEYTVGIERDVLVSRVASELAGQTVDAISNGSRSEPPGRDDWERVVDEYVATFIDPPPPAPTAIASEPDQSLDAITVEISDPSAATDV